MLPTEVIIVGVGNRLLGDEGVGPCVIDNLSRMKLPPYVDVVDCGTDLLSIAPHLDKPRKIIIIDAIRAGGEPGQTYRFDYEGIIAAGGGMRSAHQLGILDALRLLRLTYAYLADTEIVVIGTEPENMKLTAGLSKEVEQSIPELMRLALEEIRASSSSAHHCGRKTERG